MAASDESGPASKRSRAILTVALLLGVCFQYFFYDRIPGLSFPLFVGLIIGGLYFLSSRLGAHGRPGWLLLAPAFFSLMIFIRTSGLLTFLNLVATFLVLLLAVEVSAGRPLRTFTIADYLQAAFLPLKFLAPLGQTLARAFSERPASDKPRSVLSQVRRGALMATPPLVVFALLFSSADLVFRSYIPSILELQLGPEAVFRSFLALCAAAALAGAYSYIFPAAGGSSQRAPAADRSPSPQTPFRIGDIEAGVVLALLNSLFLLFIVIQFAYLFGGEKLIALKGVTYAEYARRGFFELIAVAVLSFCILRVMDEYVAPDKAQDKAHDAARGMRRVRLLTGALILQVIVIMISAFKRLWLYERAYGFTTLRLYSHAFIVFLAVIFVLLLQKNVFGAREEAFAFRSFITIAVFLAAMNLLNPDAFIARRNLENVNNPEALDATYLISLSDDAAPELLRAVQAVDANERPRLAGRLYRRFQSRSTDPAFTGWQSLNLSRARATRLLQANIAALEPYKDVK